MGMMLGLQLELFYIKYSHLKSKEERALGLSLMESAGDTQAQGITPPPSLFFSVLFFGNQLT